MNGDHVRLAGPEATRETNPAASENLASDREAKNGKALLRTECMLLERDALDTGLSEQEVAQEARLSGKGHRPARG